MYRVIVPLDGSDLSERAVPFGLALTRSLRGTLELVHVLEEPIAFDLLPSLLLPNRSAAEHYLEKIASTLPDDLAVTPYVIRGNPTEELLRLTHDQPETILVMSTHGRGGLGRIMYGSVADKVLRGASVPVGLVRASGRPHAGVLQHLLVPLDGSPMSAEALPFATDIARHAGGNLTLLSVIEPFWSSAYLTYAPELGDEDREDLDDFDTRRRIDARTYLARRADDLSSEGIEVSWDVRIGRPVDEIVRMADETACDLIVMSTHGRGGIRRWALGSVMNEVLHRGTVPILAIPPKMRAREAAEMAEMLSTVDWQM